MRTKNFFWAGVAALAVVLAALAASKAAGQSSDPYADPFADPDQVDGTRVVYYQVVYEDDEIRDLSAVPTTNENITSVLRISRTGSAVGSYERIHTGDPTVREVATPEVTREYLSWNGMAWVGEPDASANSAEGRAQAISDEFDRTQATLEALEERLADCDHLVAALQRDLAGAADDDKARIERQLKEASDKQEGLVATIADYQRRASVLRDALAGGGNLLEETGEVVLVDVGAQDEAPDGQDTPQALREVTLEHSMQVWRVKRDPGDTGRRLRRYEVSMQHPVAGAHGAFYYVAYADTTGDGEPDTLIAQSPLANAAKPGQWTSWSFTTDYADVFVGNAWPNSNTSHYVVTPSSQGGSTGVAESPDLEQIAHIGGIWWEGPGATDNRFGAYLTNINLSELINTNPDPDADDGRFDSGITEK